MCIRFARMHSFHRGLRAWRAHKVLHAYLGDLVGSVDRAVRGEEAQKAKANLKTSQKSDCCIVVMSPVKAGGAKAAANSRF